MDQTNRRPRALQISAVLIILLSSLMLLAPPPAAAQTPYVVTNTAADGDGSLMAAVLAANNYFGPNIVTFDIPGSDPNCSADNVCTIRLENELPVPLGELTIDGAGADITIGVVDPETNPLEMLMEMNGNHDSATIVNLNRLTIIDRGIFNHGGELNVIDSAFTDIKYSAIRNRSKVNFDVAPPVINFLAVLNVSNSFFSGNNTSGNLTSIFIEGGAIANYDGEVTVTGSTFTENRTPGERAGAFVSVGSLSKAWVTSSTFHDNSAAFGGAIHAQGFMEVINSTFSENFSFYGGGAIQTSHPSSNITFRNNTFYNNRSDVNSSTIYRHDGTLTLTNNVIISTSTDPNCYNVMGDESNLSHDASCTGTATDDLALEPLADNGGRTLTNLLPPGSPAIDHAAGGCPDFDQRGIERPEGEPCDAGAVEMLACGGPAYDADNDAELSEAIRCVNAAESDDQAINITDDFTVYTVNDDWQGTPPLSNDDVKVTINGHDHTLTGDGNGRFFTIENNSEVLVIDLTLTGGKAEYGGAIYAEISELEVTDSVFVDNLSTIAGGALFGIESYLTATRSLFRDNFSENRGGAVYTDHNTGPREVTKLFDSTFDGNESVNGGGAFSLDEAAAEVKNSTFVGNNTGNNNEQFGGAIMATFDSKLTVTNSTFTENSAWQGGAIGNAGEASVTHSTFFSNESTEPGGAIYSIANTLNLKNSLLVGNGEVACASAVTADVSNIVDSGSACYDAMAYPANQIKLQPLADNGGPTMTHALWLDSLAINYSFIDEAAALPTDQRGVERPSGFSHDAGAFEAERIWISVKKTTDPAGGEDFPFTIDADGITTGVMWGEFGDEAAQFHFPLGVAIDADGNVYVADKDNHRIQKFTRHGTFMLAFGKNVKAGGDEGFEVCTREDICQKGRPGAAAGEFSGPSGVAVDAEGNVYVVDSSNHRIQKFTGEGDFIMTFGRGVAPDIAGDEFEICESNCQGGLYGAGAGHFSGPQGVAVDATGNIYVSDSSNNRIQKFNSEGDFLMTFGWNVLDDANVGFEVCLDGQPCKRGDSDTRGGSMISPFGLEVDAAGNIYVADAFNFRIQKFAADGSFLLALGKDVIAGNGHEGYEVCRPEHPCKEGRAGGGEAGEFSFSYDVAVDAYGDLLVGDNGGNRVQKFSSEGDFLLAFGWNVVEGDGEAGFEVCLPSNNCQAGEEGSAQGQFFRPGGLAVDASGNIYVVDTSNHRVQAFTLPAPKTSFILNDSNIKYLPVPPGDYTITELVPEGWEIDFVDCQGSDFSSISLDATTVVKVGDEGEANCTYYNVEVVTDPCPPIPGNTIANFCFEDGSAPWKFHSDGHGVYNVTPYNVIAGNGAAEIKITTPGSNVQFYQTNVALEGGKQYELRFYARSNDGRDMSVILQKHGSPYTSYGLSGFVADLTTEWQEFSTTFNTPAFGNVTDGRLRFWFGPYDAAGTVYYIDRVAVRPYEGDTPPPVDDPLPPPPPVVPGPGECNDPVDGNAVTNPGFENEKTKWSFYTNGAGNFTTPNTSGGAYECDRWARVQINTPGNNVQLFQTGIPLLPDTAYELRLAARSSGGQDMQVFVQQHSAPYSNYGLTGLALDLTTEWQVIVVTFDTRGFSEPTTDTRLRFWLAPYDAAGVVYEFDDVVLRPLPDAPVERQTAADRAATATRADAYLITGYFIDANHTDRLGGGYVGAVNGCSAARASLTRLWPANNKMRLVSISNIGTPQSVSITGVWQDEPTGNEADAIVTANGSAVYLRAERDGDDGADGRVYTVAFQATYANGQTCNGVVTVGVPTRYGRGIEAVSGGELFGSTD